MSELDENKHGSSSDYGVTRSDRMAELTGVITSASATGSPSSNLKSLLERITPLPWKSYGNEILNGPRENRTYQIHAGNVLPEILETLEYIHQSLLDEQFHDLNDWDKYTPETQIAIMAMTESAKSAIERINSVKMENDEPTNGGELK